MPDEKVYCDHCGEEVRRGRGGWWVTTDGMPECNGCSHGHEVKGSPR